MNIDIRRKIINFLYSRDISYVTKRISLYVKNSNMKNDMKLLMKSIPHTAPENISEKWFRLGIIINNYIKGIYHELKKEEKVIVDILIGVL